MLRLSIKTFSKSWVKHFSQTTSKSSNTSHLPTVYALSTSSAAKSAIAIIRMTGNSSLKVYQYLTRKEHIPTPKKALLSKLYSPKDNSLLDTSIVLYFKGPNSFTGEDILEFHLHGGIANITSVIRAIESIKIKTDGKVNVRYAEPGEFSRRSFLNGKSDLTKLEGIRDLINAETESQRKSIISSFSGDNYMIFKRWRKELIDHLTHLTAIIDFGEDIELDDTRKIFDECRKGMLKISNKVNDMVEQLKCSKLLQNGIKVVLVGAPNVGKSSLINLLVNDDVSIVSKIPGTTRDTIDAFVDFQGYKVIFSDTAGIRNGSMDEIEVIGIDRTKKKLKNSDLGVLVLNINEFNDDKQIINDEIDQILQSTEGKGKIGLIIVNKLDLITDKESIKKLEMNIKNVINNYEALKSSEIVFTSCKDKLNKDQIVNQLVKIFKKMIEYDNRDPLIMSTRVQNILQNEVQTGITSLTKYIDANNYDVVIACETLKEIADSLGKITGDAIGVEEILDSVFSNFCIGK